MLWLRMLLMALALIFVLYFQLFFDFSSVFSQQVTPASTQRWSTLGSEGN